MKISETLCTLYYLQVLSFFVMDIVIQKHSECCIVHLLCYVMQFNIKFNACPIAELILWLLHLDVLLICLEENTLHLTCLLASKHW